MSESNGKFMCEYLNELSIEKNEQQSQWQQFLLLFFSSSPSSVLHGNRKEWCRRKKIMQNVDEKLDE